MKRIPLPRHRSRTRGATSYSKTISYRLKRANGSYATGTRTCLTFMEHENMSDVVGRINSYNPVEHRHYWFKRNEDAKVFYFTNGNPWIRWDPFYLTNFSQFSTGMVDTSLKPGLGFFRSDSTFQNFQNAAFDNFTEQVPDVLDVFNVIRDLISLKGLAKQIGRKTGSILSKLRSIFKSEGKGPLGGRTLRGLTSDAADAYLINQFGVQSDIREVEGMIGVFSPILRRLAFLRRTEGRKFICRYMEQHQPVHPADLASTTDGTSGHTQVLHFVNPVDLVTFNATAVIQNNLKGLSGPLSQAEAIWAGIGGTHAWAFMWDLVPFSFVVDYFVQIDEWLRRHVSDKPYLGSLDVVDVGTSWKGEYRCDVVLRCPDHEEGDVSLGTIYQRSFSRKRGLSPNLALYTPFSGLSPKQLAILSALALQRVR